MSCGFKTHNSASFRIEDGIYWKYLGRLLSQRGKRIHTPLTLRLFPVPGPAGSIKPAVVGGWMRISRTRCNRINLPTYQPSKYYLYASGLFHIKGRRWKMLAVLIRPWSGIDIFIYTSIYMFLYRYFRRVTATLSNSYVKM